MLRRSHREASKLKLDIVFERQNVNGVSRLKGTQITVPTDYPLITGTSNNSLEPKPSSREQGQEELMISQVTL